MPSINITSSQQITTQPGSIEKVIVNSHTTGSFRIYNGTPTQTALNGTYTFASGSQVVDLQPLDFDTGLYLAVGGTVNLTVIYNEKQLR